VAAAAFPDATRAPAAGAQGHIKTLLLLTYENWIADDGFRLAAALAYYALLSLAPLVLVAVVIAGSVLNPQRVQFLLATRVYAVVGASAALVVQDILQDLPRRSTGVLSGIVGIILLFVGASAVFSELQDALNMIWRSEDQRRSFFRILRDRAYSFLLVVVAASVLFMSVVLTTVALAARSVAATSWEVPTRALHFGGGVLSVCVTVLLFALIFKLVPRKHVPWSEVRISAAVSGVLFEVGKLLIALYLGKGGFTSLYGAAGSLVAFVIWVYYSAIVLYVGAEFGRAYSSVFGNPS
jgi:membrane protein